MEEPNEKMPGHVKVFTAVTRTTITSIGGSKVDPIVLDPGESLWMPEAITVEGEAKSYLVLEWFEE